MKQISKKERDAHEAEATVAPPALQNYEKLINEQNIMDKIQINFNFSRAEAEAFCFLADIEMTDEIWERLAKEPIQPDPSKLGKTEGKQLQLAVFLIALGITLQKND